MHGDVHHIDGRVADVRDDGEHEERREASESDDAGAGPGEGNASQNHQEQDGVIRDAPPLPIAQRVREYIPKRKVA